MTPELKAFLAATDLDELLAAREAITNVAVEDTEEIIRILEQWTDPQPVANLLMYPDLIPSETRLIFVLKGLDDRQMPYFILAAVVGSRRLEISCLSEDEQTQLVDRLIAINEIDNGILAGRAAIVLADTLVAFKKNYAVSIVKLLDHTSELVRHNILVVLIPLVGLENLRQFLNASVAEGRLSIAGREFAEEQMRGINGFRDDNTVDMAQFDLGNLSTSRLSYIPNLDEWLQIKT